MAEIKHDITIHAKCETVYQALTTPQGLKSWFTSQVHGFGQIGTNWELEFTNEPSMSWLILAAEHPTHVAWKCLEGPANTPGTKVEFILKPISNNQTMLTLIQQGWPSDPKFTYFANIWCMLMKQLQHYAETGMAEPAYHL
jgi:uncharacterized protein YndB with AHSA1/START domain